MMISLLSPAERRTMKIEFDLNGLLRGDSVARANLYRVLFATGALKPNDARRLEGLDPLPGDAAEQTYVMTNMAPLAMLMDVLMKNGASPAAPDAEDGDGDVKGKLNGTAHLNS